MFCFDCLVLSLVFVISFFNHLELKMCERNDLPGEDGASNLVYHRFKKKLIEAYVIFVSLDKFF